MNISRTEAFDILQKWESEQALLRITCEVYGTEVQAKDGTFQIGMASALTGKISELHIQGAIMKRDEEDFLLINLDTIATYQYKDAREAPEHSKEWAEKSIEGCLILTETNQWWYWSIFELKEA
jgi:hypothetical protein